MTMKIELDGRKVGLILTGLILLREQYDQIWWSNTPEAKVIKKQIDCLRQEIREG